MPEAEEGTEGKERRRGGGGGWHEVPKSASRGGNGSEGSMRTRWAECKEEASGGGRGMGVHSLRLRPISMKLR